MLIRILSTLILVLGACNTQAPKSVLGEDGKNEGGKPAIKVDTLAMEIAVDSSETIAKNCFPGYCDLLFRGISRGIFSTAESDSLFHEKISKGIAFEGPFFYRGEGFYRIKIKKGSQEYSLDKSLFNLAQGKYAELLIEKKDTVKKTIAIDFRKAEGQGLRDNMLVGLSYMSDYVIYSSGVIPCQEQKIYPFSRVPGRYMNSPSHTVIEPEKVFLSRFFWNDKKGLIAVRVKIDSTATMFFFDGTEPAPL